jgi:hypothetical protein
VKLIDAWPEGESYRPEMAGLQMGIGFEIFRGRYIGGFDKPRALTAGKIENYKFGLPNVDHVFLKGHRIMVQVQSTWFPVIDRNPQTFVPNIFMAKETDFKPATQKIFRSGRNASYIALPIEKK